MLLGTFGEEIDDEELLIWIEISGVSRSLDKFVPDVTDTSELILVLESGLSSFIFDRYQRGRVFR